MTKIVCALSVLLLLLLGGNFGLVWAVVVYNTPTTMSANVLTAKATDNETASAVSSPVNVTVLVGDGRPMITSFAPTGGVAGDSVVILGNNLGIATSVQFGALAGAFTANNASQITATVPVNAVTAPITVSNSYGTVTTTNNFSILPIIFREDFSSITGGNNTSSGGSSTAWAGNVNFPAGTGDWEAGGAIRLGSGSAVGSITSRSIDLSGNGGAFTVSFKVKGVEQRGRWHQGDRGHAIADHILHGDHGW